MYTQCSKCETVFKLSAEVLRAAGGQVRCGKCGEVFNALARLAEDASTFATGESQLDLEARADRILESVVVLQVAQDAAKDYEGYAAPGVEIAQLEVQDWEQEDPPEHQETDVRPAGIMEAGLKDVGTTDSGATDAAALDSADRSMEFTLPPGELDRIFVESKKRGSQSAPHLAPLLAPLSATPSAPQSGPQSAPQSAAQPLPQSTQQSPPSRVGTEPRRESDQGLDPESAAGSTVPELPPPHPESTDVSAAPARSRVSAFEVPEDVRRDMLAGFDEHIRPANELQSSKRQKAQRRLALVWLSAAVVSALLLAAQVVHQNREWIIANSHGVIGAGVRAVYGALGAPLPAPANLSAYELRQWGVTGDPDANGTLRVRASILNTAAQLQPYPLLRVTLANRFGTGIGARDFAPAEYLGKPTARLLAPGERVDATLAILDPGKNAEGFEIDVCLRGADQRIICQSDAASQTKR